MCRQGIEVHDAGTSQVGCAGQAGNRWHRGTSTDIDKNLRCIQRQSIDYKGVVANKTGVAFNDREASGALEQGRDPLIGLFDNRILARLDAGHVYPDLTIDHDAVSCAVARHMGRSRAGDQGFTGNASDVHTGATKQLALDDGGFFTGFGKTNRKGRPRLAGSNHNRVIVFGHSESFAA